MLRRLILSLSILVLAFPARAQYSCDTTSFKATQLIAPGVAAGTGLAIHYFAHNTLDASIQQWFYDGLRQGGAKPVLEFDNYLQYGPLTMDLGLGLLGVPAKHSFVDRAIECAIAHISLGVMSWTCKVAFNTERPNGVDNRSFPSGHTDLVMTGAELVRMEYGGWWGLGAYAMGVTVGTMRMYNNWHWFSDVLFGTGIGILSANIGGWLLEPVKDLFHIPDITWDGFGSRHHNVSVAFMPAYDPFSRTGNVYLSIAL